MKSIKMPPAVEGLPSPHELIRSAVLPNDFWRGSEKRTEQALEVFAALDEDPPVVKLTAEVRETLLLGMVLEGKTMNPPAVNREYLRLQRAVQKAEDVD